MSEMGSFSEVGRRSREVRSAPVNGHDRPRYARPKVPCVDGSELARTFFTSQAGRCSHVFGLFAVP